MDAQVGDVKKEALELMYMAFVDIRYLSREVNSGNMECHMKWITGLCDAAHNMPNFVAASDDHPLRPMWLSMLDELRMLVGKYRMNRDLISAGENVWP